MKLVSPRQTNILLSLQEEYGSTCQAVLPGEGLGGHNTCLLSPVILNLGDSAVPLLSVYFRIQHSTTFKERQSVFSS